TAGDEGHAQKPGQPAHLFQKWARGRRRDVGVAEVRARGRVEQGGAVANRAGHRVLDDQPAEEITVVWAQRVAAARGLETEEAAARRWNTNRASAVISVCHGDETCRNRRGRPAARAARRQAEAPRIAGWSEEPGLGGRKNSELGGVRLADDDQPGPLQAARQLAVGLGRVPAVEEGGALGGAHSSTRG